MKKLLLFLIIALGFVAQARAGGIDTLWTEGNIDTMWTAGYNNVTGVMKYLILSPTEDTIYAATSTYRVVAFNARTGKMLYYLNHGTEIYAMALSSDGKHLATGGDGRQIKIWNTETQNIDTTLIDNTLTSDSGRIYSLQYTKNGSLFVLQRYNSFMLETFRILVFDETKYSLTKTIALEDACIQMALTPDENSIGLLGVQNEGGKNANWAFRLLDRNADTTKIVIPVDNGSGFKFSNDSKTVALFQPQRINLVSLLTGESFAEYSKSGESIYCTELYNDFQKIIIHKIVDIGLEFINMRTKLSFGTIKHYLHEINDYWAPPILLLNNDNTILFGGGLILACYDISHMTSVEEALKTSSTIYPNPSTGKVTLDINDNYETINVIISNISGIQFKCNTTRYHDLIELDISELPSGTYMITLKTNVALTSYKFVKE